MEQLPLTPVYSPLELFDRIYNLIEIRLTAEIHLSHFLVVLPKAPFEPFARSQTQRPRLCEFVVCSSLAKEMLFVCNDFLQQMCVLRNRGVSALMPGNYNEIVIVSEDPFSDLLSGFGSIIFPVKNRRFLPKRSFCTNYVDGCLSDRKKAWIHLCSVGCHGRLLAGNLVSTTSEFEPHRPSDVTRNLRIGKAFRVSEFDRVGLGCIRIDLNSRAIITNY